MDGTPNSRWHNSIIWNPLVQRLAYALAPLSGPLMEGVGRAQGTGFCTELVTNWGGRRSWRSPESLFLTHKGACFGLKVPLRKATCPSDVKTKKLEINEREGQVPNAVLTRNLFVKDMVIWEEGEGSAWTFQVNGFLTSAVSVTGGVTRAWHGYGPSSYGHRSQHSCLLDSEIGLAMKWNQAQVIYGKEHVKSRSSLGHS